MMGKDRVSGEKLKGQSERGRAIWKVWSVRYPVFALIKASCVAQGLKYRMANVECCLLS
jgi:hypothetical protein